MAVSPVFRSILKGDEMREGQDVAVVRAEGEVQMCDDEDPYAFEMLLDICHHRTRRVPKTVDLDIMTNIATLVSKYQMHEAVELYADLWLDELKESIPQSFNEDVIAWLSIAWVFKLPVEFKHLTRIAARETGEKLATEGLPIPDSILGKHYKPRKPTSLTCL
jgi:hypothetical protein